MQLGRVERRLLRARAAPTARAAGRRGGCTISRTMRERVLVVGGQVVGDAADARVDVGAAQLLGGHLLAGRRLHERRPAEEDRAGAAHDHGLVAHRRHVRAARGARAHHGGDLGDARAPTCAPGCRRSGRSARGRGRPRPGAAGTRRRSRPGRCTGSRFCVGDLLRAQVLLHGQREVAAALHGGVVGHDHARAAVHRADAGHDARRPAPRRRRGRGPPAARARGRRRRGRPAARSARGPAACRASCAASPRPGRRPPGPARARTPGRRPAPASVRGFGGSHPRRCRDDSRCGARASDYRDDRLTFDRRRK